jgi:hypothetical protein
MIEKQQPILSPCCNADVYWTRKDGNVDQFYCSKCRQILDDMDHLKPTSLYLPKYFLNFPDILTLQKKKQGVAIICPFSEYVSQKDKWIADHPKAVILEEIQNVFLQTIQVPDIGIIKGFKAPNEPQNIIMIIDAIVYEEPIPINK